MKVYIFLLAATLFCLTSSTTTKEKQTDITKSLKILNIHDTKDAKILLA